MNDIFLYQSKPKIREEFSSELYASLSNPMDSPWQQIKLAFTQMRRPKVFASMILLLAVFVACAQQFLSPDYHLAKEANGLYVYESNYKIVHLDYYDLSKFQKNSEENQNYDKSQFSQYFTIEEAMELYHVPFNWPIYTPEGYKASSSTYQPNQNFFNFNLVNADGNAGIYGMVFVHEKPYSLSPEIIVAPKKWKSIDLKGIPAILIRGDFEYFSIEEIIALKEAGENTTEAYWNDDLGLRLVWFTENVRYELSTPTLLGYLLLKSDDPEPTELISEEELIRIAESMIR